MADILDGEAPGDNYPISDGPPVTDPGAQRQDQIGKPDSPQPPEQRRAFVKELQKEVDFWAKKYDTRFKQMRSDLKFCWDGYDSAVWGEDKYVANITARHVRQKTASLYAKNPRARARRADRLFFQLWDGSTESAQAAMQLMGMAVAGNPVPPALAAQMGQAQALVADIAQGLEKQKLLDRIGKALEILFHYYIGEGNPPFKEQAKQLIRRVIGCGVGYVKLGFQRAKQKNPESQARLDDFQGRLSRIMGLMAEITDGTARGEMLAEKQELEFAVKALTEEPEILLREGIVFDFPRAWDIVPCGPCTSLKGFIGATMVAQRMLFTVKQIKEIYGVDVVGHFTAFNDSGKEANDSDDGKSMGCVWEIYHKADGLLYTTCEGYPDFLEEPRKPSVSLPQFFPHYTLSFNDLEHEKNIFPESDVHYIRNMQAEQNRQREALRQHRIANQPKYGASEAAFEFTDEQKLMSAVPHEILKLRALAPGQKVSDVISAFPMLELDPRLYDTAQVNQDYLQVLGQDLAGNGTSTGAATATEETIAAQARSVSTSSDVDELDALLTALARGCGVVMLTELDPETVKKIAGPGAVWPQLSRAEVQDDLYLEVEAGSSGKPNQAVELANWSKMLPLLIQIPGISPVWIARETVKRLDDRVDLSEAIAQSIPAIMALNAQQQAAMKAPPGAGPSQQGGHGGDNAKRPPQQAPAPQAAFPAPGAAVGGAPAGNGTIVAH